jgi:hypothetical protein
MTGGTSNFMGERPGGPEAAQLGMGHQTYFLPVTKRLKAANEFNHPGRNYGASSPRIVSQYPALSTNRSG